VSALLTEELLKKIMLAKTKHKKLWKFYWNPHYVRSVGTLPNKGNNNGTVLQGAFKRESPQKTDKAKKKLNHLSFQSTELLEKIMLAKTKHKKLWKFYWNPLCCLGRVMDSATVPCLYCIALYDNYIALNDKVQKWRNFSKNC
jgi:hypothetical protein